MVTVHRVLKDSLVFKVIKEQQELVSLVFKVMQVFKDSQEMAVVQDLRVRLVMLAE